jgi:hypothetical protein
MSLLHRDEPPETGVNDVLAVEGHWLDQHFRVNVRLDPYHSGAASLCLAQAGLRSHNRRGACGASVLMALGAFTQYSNPNMKKIDCICDRSIVVNLRTQSPVIHGKQSLPGISRLAPKTQIPILPKHVW